MKKFQFKMDTLLKVHSIEEKAKLVELAKALGKVNSCEQEINQYSQEFKRILNQEALAFKKGGFDLKLVLAARSYFSVLKGKKRVAELEIKKHQEKLEFHQKEVQEARKKRKVLEILREKKYQNYKLELEKEETKAIDEFNLQKRG